MEVCQSRKNFVPRTANIHMKQYLKGPHRVNINICLQIHKILMNGMIKLFLIISVNFCESPFYRISCSHFRERLREFHITEEVIYSTLNESLVTHK